VVDPALHENQHHVLVNSQYGEMRLQLSNTPSPDNPKTSWVVAQSVANVVKREFENIHFS
jgi:aspartate dehydrogenase